MKQMNTATWTKDGSAQWALMVDFKRHWEAPKVGTGLGSEHEVVVHLANQRGPGRRTIVRLTSRVFTSRYTKRPAAFA